MAGRTAVILFAHGSRDPDWAAPFHAIKSRIAAAQPNLRVELAFLELMEPSLEETASNVAPSCREVIIAPLFMGQGAHLKRDLAGLVAKLRKQHPAVEFRLLPGLGEMDRVLDAISASIVQSATGANAS